ncbi:hypothetical protein SDC9_61471 [bioreactor metagenome]|uniref:Uncharacterized protein n=1 Tax=bioreactor metagenome TaxID=1076179 RepID=A0A644XFV4_9ZZZZ
MRVIFIAADFRTYNLTFTATRTVFLNYIPGVLGNFNIEVFLHFYHAVHLATEHQCNIRMTGGFRHLGSRDTSGTVERGENLAQLNHLSTDGKTFFHEQHLFTHISEVQRRFLSGNTTPDDHCIIRYFLILHIFNCTKIPDFAG